MRKTRLSRRQLLAGAAALAVARPARATPELDADVVVVGAGFAGLSAARTLQAAGKRVVVLEARQRIGGRTSTEELPGGIHIDVGAQWIGPTQTRIVKLARELGAETFDTYDTGGNLLDDAGRLRKYTGTVPGLPGPFGFLSVANVGAAMWQLDRMAARLDPARPWAGANAAAQDSQSFAEWLKHHVPLAPARRLFEAGMRVVFAAEASQYSLLHALFYIRSAGSLDALLAVKGGAQASRFKHGTADLARRLAAPFARSIRFNAPVRRILQDAATVTVQGDGVTLRAAHAIVAVPPPLVREIEFAPKLSDARTRLLAGLPMGAVIKCLAVYPEPFWRADGLSGQSVATAGPFTATYDNSVPYAKDGILLGFLAGADAEKLRQVPPAERRRVALDAFARFFGPRALTPTHYTDHVWHDETWSRGCYSAVFGPELWTQAGPTIRAPEGRIHWAGTETATEWHGYMEGAIESGERAAREVL